jgi:hypothetical protein
MRCSAVVAAAAPPPRLQVAMRREFAELGIDGLLAELRREQVPNPYRSRRPSTAGGAGRGANARRRAVASRRRTSCSWRSATSTRRRPRSACSGAHPSAARTSPPLRLSASPPHTAHRTPPRRASLCSAGRSANARRGWGWGGGAKADDAAFSALRKTHGRRLGDAADTALTPEGYRRAPPVAATAVARRSADPRCRRPAGEHGP